MKGVGMMNNRFLLFIVLVLSIIIVAPGPVFSQVEKAPSDGIYTLGEIVVTGERDGVESVGTVHEITAEDIRNQGARTLEEALTLLPGLHIRAGAAGVPRVDLRGFRGRHVVLLLDGIPFNSTYDGQFDPSIISLESVAKIKVSYGTHSALYGDGGLAGVINIVTKKGKQEFEGAVSGEMGNRDTRLGKVSLGGAQEKFDFFVGASAYETDGFALSDDFTPSDPGVEDGGLRENSDSKRKNLFVNLGLTPTEDLVLGLVVTKARGEFGNPPGTINDTAKVDPFDSSPKYVRVEDYDGESAQLSASYNVSEDFELRVGMYLNQMEEQENSYDDDQCILITRKNTYSQESKTKVTGGNLQANYDMGSAGSLALGFNGRQEKYEVEGWKNTKNNTPSAYSDNRSTHTYMGAIEYTVSPVDDLGVVLGYSHHWFEKDTGEKDHEGSYLAGVYYDLREGTRIKGSYARKIRFPSIRQLYEEPDNNPDLKPETSNNYELGITQRLPYDTSLGLTGFYIEAENYIEKDEITDENENNENYRFRGYEVTAETRFIENLMLRAAYTFLDTKDKTPGTEKTDLQYRPRHKISFEGKYGFDFGLSAYLSIMHVRGQNYYSKVAPLQKAELNNYTLVDTKIAQELLKGMLTLYIGIDNLFDEDYEESYGFANPGRYYYGGVAFKF